MTNHDLHILVAPDGGHRVLRSRGVSIRLLTVVEIAKLSPKGLHAYRKKFLQLKVMAGFDEEFLWKGDAKMDETKGAAFKAFDYLRHAIQNEVQARAEDTEPMTPLR